MRLFLALTAAIAGFFGQTQALDNGLARTPAMGYNSWYDVGCGGDMNEDIIKATADAIVEKGLDKLGYKYVNVSICM